MTKVGNNRDIFTGHAKKERERRSITLATVLRPQSIGYMRCPSLASSSCPSSPALDPANHPITEFFAASDPTVSPTTQPDEPTPRTERVKRRNREHVQSVIEPTKEPHQYKDKESKRRERRRSSRGDSRTKHNPDLSVEREKKQYHPKKTFEMPMHSNTSYDVSNRNLSSHFRCCTGKCSKIPHDSSRHFFYGSGSRISPGTSSFVDPSGDLKTGFTSRVDYGDSQIGKAVIRRRFKSKHGQNMPRPKSMLEPAYFNGNQRNSFLIRHDSLEACPASCEDLSSLFSSSCHTLTDSLEASETTISDSTIKKFDREEKSECHQTSVNFCPFCRAQ